MIVAKKPSFACNFEEGFICNYIFWGLAPNPEKGG